MFVSAVFEVYKLHARASMLLEASGAGVCAHALLHNMALSAPCFVTIRLFVHYYVYPTLL